MAKLLLSRVLPRVKLGRSLALPNEPRVKLGRSLDLPNEKRFVT